MPVNTAALKTFAPAMRRQLLEAVGRKLDLLLNSQTPDTLSTYAKQIAELREQEAENRELLLERVAYTWFNRLCALRYLDARAWHPFGCKVLMPAAEGETQPELLKLMRAGSLPAELKPLTNEARLHGLLDGQIQPAISGADPQGEVYRELVLASSRSYHQLLPELFERLDDASELLLPDDLLSEGSIAGGFRNSISDADCEDVEIIGWLYQFYISEKKDQVIGKVVKCEDIPAATQLFTPNWIVKYMVQNSLGATWLGTYPASALKGQMEYYIEPAEQNDEVNASLAAITSESLNPEELTLIDPACGSGHILVEAYDLLKAIYLERGYQQREIPQLILEKNLFGLDIDERAAQLTSFALMMKGRGDDRRLFERGVKLNVMALVNSDGLDTEGLANVINLSDYGLKLAELTELKNLFEHATTFGSLIVIPPRLSERLPVIKRLCESASIKSLMGEGIQRLSRIVLQAEILAAKYEAVAANPPYMGRKYHIAELKKFLEVNYSQASSDLFSAFTIRCSELGRNGSRIAIMNPNVWMFISSHQNLRRHILDSRLIESLIELPLSGFKGATVQICSFVLRNTVIPGFISRFVRLVDFGGGDIEMASLTRQAISSKNTSWHYEVSQLEFNSISGSPISYWISLEVRKIFRQSQPFSKKVDARQGMATGDNDRFIRLWHEVCFSRLEFGVASVDEAFSRAGRWFPYNKGGEYRKWYGNREHVICFSKSDYKQLKGMGNHCPSESFYFRPSVSWSRIGTGITSFRVYEPGFLFDQSGHSIFPIGDQQLHHIAVALNTKFYTKAVKTINPTLNLEVGNIGILPFPVDESTRSGKNFPSLSQASKVDWDAYERSWDFRSLPLLDSTSISVHSVESGYAAWIETNKRMIVVVQGLEQENNSLFNDAYELTNELDSLVPIEQITLTVNPSYRYGINYTDEERWSRFRRDTIAELLSYAVGCMMGRYSLDHPGLILADSCDSQATQLAAYEQIVGKPLNEVQFKPDPDGIIPVLDGEWFEDDIVARTREFLEVTFPESTVTENLRFIEESLGKDVRKYFCSDFYKDHLQTYKKRPIYWMVQSPKKAFACLIYLHRYTKDTLNQVLNNYFRPYLQKLEARLAQLGFDQLNDDLPTRERTAARKEAEKITKVLKECQAWEQDALLPLAQQRIELDLDDGVKVNYLKLQDVLAPIPGLAAKED